MTTTPGHTGTDPAQQAITPRPDPAHNEPAPSDAMRTAKPPVGTGASPLVAQLIALAFILIGAVGIMEVLSSTGAIKTTSRTAAAVDALDGLRSDSAWVPIVGVVLVILGVLLLPIVFKPRPRKGLPLDANTGVYLRTRDIARIAESALAGATTVTDVTVKATRRQLKVAATTLAAKDRNAAITDDLRSRLAPCVAALERQPRVKVSVHNQGPS